MEVKSFSPIQSGQTYIEVNSDDYSGSQYFFTDTHSRIYCLVTRKNGDESTGNYYLLGYLRLEGYNNGVNFDYRIDLSNFIYTPHYDVNVSEVTSGSSVFYQFVMPSNNNIFNVMFNYTDMMQETGFTQYIQTYANGYMYIGTGKTLADAYCDNFFTINLIDNHFDLANYGYVSELHNCSDFVLAGNSNTIVDPDYLDCLPIGGEDISYDEDEPCGIPIKVGYILRTETGDFRTAYMLFAGSDCQTFADAGYYIQDGFWRYWDGNGFISEGICAGYYYVADIYNCYCTMVQPDIELHSSTPLEIGKFYFLSATTVAEIKSIGGGGSGGEITDNTPYDSCLETGVECPTIPTTTTTTTPAPTMVTLFTLTTDSELPVWQLSEAQNAGNVCYWYVSGATTMSGTTTGDWQEGPPFNFSGITGDKYITVKSYVNALTTIKFSGSQGIKNIDLSNATHLIDTTLYQQKLTSLDISNCKNLTDITVSSNFLTSIDVSNQTGLTSIDLSNNDVDYFDISGNTKIVFLNLRFNSLIDTNIVDIMDDLISFNYAGIYFDARNQDPYACVQQAKKDELDAIWTTVRVDVCPATTTTTTPAPTTTTTTPAPTTTTTTPAPTTTTTTTTVYISGGTIDSSFNIGTGFNGTIYDIKVQSDGKILAGGGFTSYNGTARNYIVRLNTGGTIDTSFDIGVGFNSYVHEMNILSSGKIYVGGLFTTYRGSSVNYAVRLNTGATLDTSFNGGLFNSFVFGLSATTSDSLFAGGQFSNKFVKVLSNGNTDTSFDVGAGFNTFVTCMAVQPDGKVLVGGNFTTYKGTTVGKFVRLLSGGTLDSTFNTSTGFNGTVDKIIVLSDGKILVGGQFTSYNGVGVNRIARVNDDASLDSSFSIGTGFNGPTEGICVQPDGKYVVGGGFTSFNGTSVNSIIRLNSGGTVDTSFNVGTGLNGGAETIEMYGTNHIVVGGDFTSFNGTTVNKIVRLYI